MIHLFLMIISLSALAHQPLKLRADLYSEFDNGYMEDRFNKVIDTIFQIYSPIIQNRGGELIIKKDWSDGAVNAFADRIGNEYHLEILGGLSRYSFITEDAFITLICHELGHLLGGFPKGSQISVEGQADYFSTSKCNRRIFAVWDEWNNPQVLAPDQASLSFIDSVCSDKLCQRSLRAAHQIGKLWGRLDNNRFPKFTTPSTQITRSTLSSHPSAQCRLDTYLAGTLCPVSMNDDFSYQSEKLGACGPWNFPKFGRPICWFKPSN